MSTFPPWHPRWGEGMPSPSPRSRPLVVEPASQLLRRKTHRVEVIARSIRVLGVRPLKNTPTSTSSRSKLETRTTNRLDVISDELLTLPELEDNRSSGVPQQPGNAVAPRLRVLCVVCVVCGVWCSLFVCSFVRLFVVVLLCVVVVVLLVLLLCCCCFGKCLVCVYPQQHARATSAWRRGRAQPQIPYPTPTLSRGS